MRRGAWHQCGDRSQKLVQEQLEQQIGVGVVLSPRDLARDNAIAYAAGYRAQGADLLLDHQFHNPDFTNRFLDTYPISTFRTTVSELRNISDQDLINLGNELRTDNAALNTTAVLAPAVMYEAGRPDIVQLNARLFGMARQVGNDLARPTIATLVLARSVTASDETLGPVLSQATALEADGWYFAFEFEDERIPSDADWVRRCSSSVLTLACTGKPVLHAYAGPMGILSFGVGATGVAIGHSQNLWKFTTDRWEPATGRGGGGDAPPRFFSSRLWGTVVYPDETTLMTAALRNEILTHSPFSGPVASNLNWPRWDAGKHMVYILGSILAGIAQSGNARTAAQAALTLLDRSVETHARIADAGLALRDETNVYQANWRNALAQVLTNQSDDYDYLEMLS